MSEELKPCLDIRVIGCEQVPEDTIYLIPPIPVLRNEDIFKALMRHLKNHPEQFGVIKNTRKEPK